MLPALDKTLLRRGWVGLRRLLLLASLALLFSGALLTYLAPSLDELRPEIEANLMRELALESLQLGKLSWHWSGDIVISAYSLSFTSADKRLSLEKGDIDIHLSLLNLFIGRAKPKRIALHGGILHVNLTDGFGGDSASAIALPDFILTIEKTLLKWRFGDQSGTFAELALQLDGPDGTATVRLPQTRLDIALDPMQRIEQFEVEFENTHWMPKFVRSRIHGDAGGLIRLQQVENGQWQWSVSLHANSQATLLPTPEIAIPFDRIEGSGSATASPAPDSPSPLAMAKLERLLWQHGQDRASIAGDWHDRQLKLKLKSASLAMPQLWRWLMPISSNPQWVRWLAEMQQGRATSDQGELSLQWNDLLAPPQPGALQSLRFSVRAQAKDVDIALAIGGDRLSQIAGEATVNEHSLNAHIRHCQLPGAIGTLRGDLHIDDLSQAKLDIRGRTHADVGALVSWLDPYAVPDLVWQQAPAQGTIRLLWDPLQDQPELGEARLFPTAPWLLHYQKIPITLAGGRVFWSRNSGIFLRDFAYDSNHWDGRLDLALREIDQQWQLTRLKLATEGDLGEVFNRYQLPAEGVAGPVRAELLYLGNWHGRVDLTDCSWSNLLGGKKEKGAPLSFEFSGSRSDKGVSIEQMRSSGDRYKLGGIGEISTDGLLLKLTGVRAPAFAGNININAPFGDATLAIDVAATYLNRQALPQEISEQRSDFAKSWQLQALVDRFVWDDATIGGGLISIGSNPGSVGFFKAKTIDFGNMHLRDSEASFLLSGHGGIDVRHLATHMEDQNLTLAAQLTPNPDGGMFWQGIALLDGNFGHLASRSGLSDKLEGGVMHARFDGQGIVLRDLPWWQGMRGKLHLRVDHGRIREGGVATKILALANLADLPKLLIGARPDLRGNGLFYDRLQVDASMKEEKVGIDSLVMRSTALDLSGRGAIDLRDMLINALVVIQPMQNIDALLERIPLLRDLLGGKSHGILRKIYSISGSLADAKVVEISPEEGESASPGLIESLFSMPEKKFDHGSSGSSPTAPVKP